MAQPPPVQDVYAAIVTAQVAMIKQRLCISGAVPVAEEVWQSRRPGGLGDEGAQDAAAVWVGHPDG
jgi:hypothetical protein